MASPAGLLYFGWCITVVSVVTFKVVQGTATLQAGIVVSCAFIAGPILLLGCAFVINRIWHYWWRSRFIPQSWLRHSCESSDVYKLLRVAENRFACSDTIDRVAQRIIWENAPMGGPVCCLQYSVVSHPKVSDTTLVMIAGETNDARVLKLITENPIASTETLVLARLCMPHNIPPFNVDSYNLYSELTPIT